MRLRGTNFCINCTSQYVLQQVSCGYETIPNAPKYYETDRSISLGSNGADWVCLLRKNLRATKFCINCSSAHFTPSFVVQQNCPKYTQMVRNTPRHVFRFQSFGLGLFLRKTLMRLHGMIFYISCISFGPFCTKFCAVTKISQMHQNIKKGTKT